MELIYQVMLVAAFLPALSRTWGVAVGFGAVPAALLAALLAVAEVVDATVLAGAVAEVVAGAAGAEDAALAEVWAGVEDATEAADVETVAVAPPQALSASPATPVATMLRKLRRERVLDMSACSIPAVTPSVGGPKPRPPTSR